MVRPMPWASGEVRCRGEALESAERVACGGLEGVVDGGGGSSKGDSVCLCMRECVLCWFGRVLMNVELMWR